MQYRRFGNTELTVSAIGVGCARLGGFFQDASRDEVIRLVQQALDAGITLFDTADMYTQGESERLLGDAFRGRRQHVVIATKVGYVLPSRKRLGSRIKPLLKPVLARLGLSARTIPAGLRGSVSHQDFSAAYITQAVEQSLRRLRTDYIDVYQLHSPPRDVLERGEFVEPLERLREQGKVRYWGVACEHADDVQPSLRHQPLAAIQVGLSALEQAALDAAIPAAAARGVAIIARQVYASGLLTRPLEKLQADQIDAEPRVADRKRQQLEAYATIAAQSGRSRAELALKFALAQPDVAVALLGISRAEHLEAGLNALQAPDLTDQERQLLLASRRPGR